MAMSKKMPVGMTLIAALLVMGMLGYVWARILQLTGRLSTPFNWTSCVLGTIFLGLQLAVVIGIVKRATWGWPLALILFRYAFVSHIVRLLIGGYDPTRVPISVVIAFGLLILAIEVYVYRRKDYFSGPPDQ